MPSPADTLTEKAARLAEKGKFAEARAACEKALKKDASHVRALFLGATCAMQLDDHARAATLLERAAERQPNAPEIVNNLGVACLHSGRLDEARRHLERAVALRPDYANAHVNLANALKLARDFEAAEQHLRKAQSLAGNTPEIVADLADVSYQAQKWSQAAAAYEALVAFAPEDPAARTRLVLALARNGQTEDARARADALPLKGKARAEGLAEIADGLFKAGHETLAIDLFRDAVALDPGNVVAEAGLAQLYRKHVSRWHFTMLNDRARNEAYDTVIQALVKPGDVVLDIGSGSGLLAMMAARAGAAHVHTCEGVRIIARKAREIIAANGLAERITVHEKWSNDLVVGRDMAEKADVLISEIVDNVLIGEGIIPTLEHAISELVKPDARIVPTGGAIKALAIEAEALYGRERASEAAGFDVSAFNEFSSHGSRASLAVRPGDFTALSASEPLFSFDFTQGQFSPQEKTLTLECTRAGTLHGVLAWFTMRVHDGFDIDNDPAREDNHWGHEVFFLNEPRVVETGTQVTLHAAHDKTTLNLTIDQ